MSLSRVLPPSDLIDLGDFIARKRKKADIYSNYCKFMKPLLYSPIPNLTIKRFNAQVSFMSFIFMAVSGYYYGSVRIFRAHNFIWGSFFTNRVIDPT